jgi:hypothetical protein
LGAGLLVGEPHDVAGVSGLKFALLNGDGKGTDTDSD